MSEKFDKFKAALEALCREHDVTIGATCDGCLFVDDFTPAIGSIDPSLEDWTD